MRKEIVVTGRGLVTPLGAGLEQNEDALRQGRSGITFDPEWKEMGLESNICGQVNNNIDCPLLNKKNRRYMSQNTLYGIVAAHEAITEAGLTVEDIKNMRVAIVLGHGGSAQKITHGAAKLVEETGRTKRVSPFIVPKAMTSSAVANLSLILGVSGESYAISSACASGSHAIMIAARLIQADLYDMVITGGTEEVSWVQASGFDAMRAISRSYNDTPKKASRPFDIDRDGFVIAEGAGILVLESMEHAKSRNARAIVKISGTAANSNTTDMVVPNAEASAKVMESSLKDANLRPSDIDYINTHGTSTPVGDIIEIAAIKQIFYNENKNVAINSTKSMTGHMIGATGAIEIIFCTQMIDKNFICPTINLDNQEPETEWANLVKKTITNVKIRHALSNSFGFGGTNSSVIVSAVED
jgi:3-oxoacyl-[acyl-carrier-protein] synthase I